MHFKCKRLICAMNIASIFLLVSQIILVNGQFTDFLNTTTSENNSSMSSSSQPSRNSSIFRICDTGDILSQKYCKCSDNLIDCDFSDYPTKDTNATKDSSSALSDDEVELTLYGYNFPPNASRFCMCNVPKNVHLVFNQSDFLPSVTNTIQRFDLFNLRGETHLNGGFSKNFNGDLYMSNVYIPEIGANQFGSGYEHSIKDWQNLNCCSPIKLNQYHKPLLLMENTTIGIIQERGISDDHLWKTVIMKSVLVQNMKERAIIFDSSSDYDVAILNSKFVNVTSVKNQCMIFQDSSNLLMVKNYFKWGTHFNSWMARSSLNNSNLVAMDNQFWNEIVMNADAEKVVSWFNLFDVWDIYSFKAMRFSRVSSGNSMVNGSTSYHPKRSISFQYNMVTDVFLNNSLNFGNSSVTISKNILGSCNCSAFTEIHDKMVKLEENYCFTGVVGIEKNLTDRCYIKLNTAIQECNKKKQNPDFLSLCKNSKVSISQLLEPGESSAQNKDISPIKIYSSFINRIIEDFHSSFGKNEKRIGNLLTEKPDSLNDAKMPNGRAVNKEENNKRNKIYKHKSKRSSVAMPVFISLLLIGFVALVGVLAYKNRLRIFRRSGHEVLVESQAIGI